MLRTIEEVNSGEMIRMIPSSEIINSPLNASPHDLANLQTVSTDIIHRALIVTAKLTLINKDSLFESLMSNWFIRFKAKE